MSVATSIDLSRAWAVLDVPQRNPFVSYPLVVLVNGRPCRVALDSAGVRHVLIPISESTGVVQNVVSVLGIRDTTLVFERGIPERFADVFCADPDLNREFDDVILDVLDDVADASDSGAATGACISRWRKLFRARLADSLSFVQKLGLFAELTVLCGLLQRDSESGATWWTGPLRHSHDFETPNRCLEVKAVGGESDSILIHGIQQMEAHDARPLDLLVFALVPDAEGASLQDLAIEARSLSGQSGHLADLLQRAGLRQYEENQFSTDRFVVSDFNHVEVVGGVPRLTNLDLLGEELASGVSEVNYRVNLSSLLPHVSGLDLQSVLDEGAK